MEKVCVLGAGSTKYGKLEDSITDITLQASVSAIESAGIESKEIKSGYISNVFGVADKQVHLGPVIMSNLGISDKPSLSIESACGSGSVSFREAYANVAAGFYDVVLVTGVEKVTHTGTEWTTTYFSYCSDFFYEGQAGVSFPGLFASMARAYITEFNASEEDFAAVAVKNHENGLLNPKAHLRKKDKGGRRKMGDGASAGKGKGGWKKDKMIEVVFILKDEFDGEEAPNGKKYVVVMPVDVDVDSESHYAVKSGVAEGDSIVTGSYKAISRELQHGTLVSLGEEFGRHQKGKE